MVECAITYQSLASSQVTIQTISTPLHAGSRIRGVCQNSPDPFSSIPTSSVHRCVDAVVVVVVAVVGQASWSLPVPGVVVESIFDVDSLSRGLTPSRWLAGGFRARFRSPCIDCLHWQGLRVRQRRRNDATRGWWP